MRRTKIVATLGPASDRLETLTAMLRAGVDVVRINLSHGTEADHRRLATLVREAAGRAGKPYVAVLFDTRGPEIRVGDLGPDGVTLEEGARVVLVPDAVGAAEPGSIPITYAGVASVVRVGETLLLDDGNIVLQVEETTNDRVVCRVIAGGRLLSRKKVTLPRPPADLPALPEADLADIRAGVELGIDFVAASFIRDAEDVLAVRSAIEKFGGDQGVIAKIENAKAVENVEAILEVADGVMVARGDLGVEVPPEDVPIIQKRVIDACNRLGKPVITATQMLESMVNNPRPTRAEASDVANAIFDGTDAVMLSAETALGRYPVEAVRVMARIAQRAEEALDYEGWLQRSRRRRFGTVTDAISFASCTTAQALGAAAILTATQSGHTARMVSRHRPRAPIVAATPLERVARRLSLVWGVTPLVVPATTVTDEMMENTVRAAQEAGIVQPGALVVMTAGVPVGVPGTTNLVQVITVGEVLVSGTGVGRHHRTGVARVALRPGDLPEQEFADGDILVAPSIHEDWMPLVKRAGGLVVEEGGRTSPAAIAALHFGIPAVVGAEGATTRIASGMEVTVDGRTGMVYRGRVTIR